MTARDPDVIRRRAPAPPSRIRHAATIARLGVPYAVFALAKHVVPLPQLVRWAWLRPARSRDPEAEALLIRCVVRLRRLTRATHGDCVQGSLVLYRALSRAGASPHLVVGIRTTPGRLKGHAWITVDGRVVAETAESVAPFTPTMAFGVEGALLAAATATRDQ